MKMTQRQNENRLIESAAHQIVHQAEQLPADISSVTIRMVRNKKTGFMHAYGSAKLTTMLFAHATNEPISESLNGDREVKMVPVCE